MVRLFLAQSGIDTWYVYGTSHTNRLELYHLYIESMEASLAPVTNDEVIDDCLPGKLPSSGVPIGEAFSVDYWQYGLDIEMLLRQNWIGVRLSVYSPSSR